MVNENLTKSDFKKIKSLIKKELDKFKKKKLKKRSKTLLSLNLTM